MLLDTQAGFTEEKKHEIANFYQNYVRTEMLDVWARRTEDKEYGGYITDFDRMWNIRSYQKGAWAQGRHVYTFSDAYQLFDDEGYLHLARIGKEFTLNKMYVRHGRFNYLVDRSGTQVIDGTISMISDAFVISGLAKYIGATGGDEGGVEHLRKLFRLFAKNVMDDEFSELAPFVYQPGVCPHSKYMIGLNVSYETGKALGDHTTDELTSYCLNRILNLFYDEPSGLILEKKHLDGGRCDDENALLVNTGHVFESLWFCLEAALDRNNAELIDKIKKIAETNYNRSRGHDGHSVYCYDADGNVPRFNTWKYEIAFNDTDKVSWSYVEEMYLWALLGDVTGDEKYFHRFAAIHNFTQEHFVDKEYQDWYHALDKDNRVTHDFKGSTVKSTFHMPRAMMRIVRLFDSGHKA